MSEARSDVGELREDVATLRDVIEDLERRVGEIAEMLKTLLEKKEKEEKEEEKEEKEVEEEEVEKVGEEEEEEKKEVPLPIRERLREKVYRVLGRLGTMVKEAVTAGLSKLLEEEGAEAVSEIADQIAPIITLASRDLDRAIAVVDGLIVNESERITDNWSRTYIVEEENLVKLDVLCTIRELFIALRHGGNVELWIQKLGRKIATYGEDAKDVVQELCVLLGV